MPVPLKYTYIDNLILKIRKGKNNDSVRYYYIPELGRFIRTSQIPKRLKSVDIDEYFWMNRWIGRAINPMNLDENSVNNLINFKYKDKLDNTKNYIKDQLLKDYKYQCDFYMLKEDVIDLFLSSNKYIKFVKDYIDFSKIPEKVLLKESRISIIIEDKLISFSCVDLEKNPTRLFNEIFNLLKDRETNLKLLPNRYSYGEIFVRDWIIENSLTFKEQVVIYEVFNNKSSKVIPDFIVNYNRNMYWIEYNGKQHYEYVDYLQKDPNRFLSQLKRDENVREYCKKNNIILIEIPYIINTYEKVAKFLDKTIIQGINPNTLIDYNKLYKNK